MKRVVVTGMAGVTALGNDWSEVYQNLLLQENKVVQQDDWLNVANLTTKIAAPVMGFKKPSHYSRKKTRSMGRVSLLATRATELALEKSGLLDDPILTSGDIGVSYGSSMGSTAPIPAFGKLLTEDDMTGVTATSYIEMMAHTTAVNIALFFGCKGRIITTSSACTSGSQGIGYAYETIQMGKQKVMIAGGAEELCVSGAAVFDTLFAASAKNSSPKLTPSPFDEDRDGLVLGEGAGTLILEEYEHAISRGATIYAELVGFGTNSDGQHVTQPTSETMQVAIEKALLDANLKPADIQYVSAHGTATEKGDIAETQATYRVFGKDMPISSLKSYIGHTLGACGAVEAWLTIEMMNANWFAPNLNLSKIDPACGELDYLLTPRTMETEFVMSDNFAFGGINTSLIFKRTL